MNLGWKNFLEILLIKGESHFSPLSWPEPKAPVLLLSSQALEGRQHSASIQQGVKSILLQA